MMIKKALLESIKVKQLILEDDDLLRTIDKAAHSIIVSFKNNGRVFLCGNGGSAADAQHIAAELSGRFYYDRPPLDAEALHVNTSAITAIANDYGYSEIYSRLVNAKGKRGDILIGISTSGNSENIIDALTTALDNGLITIGLTGNTGGKMKELCNFLINVPSSDTARIQEAHITIGHILCEIVESEMFPQ